MQSHRYWTFLIKGTNCKECELEGIYFAKERNPGSKVYHFNLYGVNKQGHEILITKDHVHPKSKGGKNHINNYNTLCVKCNYKKGDKIK